MLKCLVCTLFEYLNGSSSGGSSRDIGVLACFEQNFQSSCRVKRGMVTESPAVLGQRNPQFPFIGAAIHRFVEKGLFGNLNGTRESL